MGLLALCYVSNSQHLAKVSQPSNVYSQQKLARTSKPSKSYSQCIARVSHSSDALVTLNFFLSNSVIDSLWGIDKVISLFSTSVSPVKVGTKE